MRYIKDPVAGQVEIEGQSVLAQLNNFVPAPTTNNTFSSDTNNNPYGLKFDDLKMRFGIERVMFAGMEEIPDSDGQSYDSSGLKGYYPVNAATGKVEKRIRFYGNWTIELQTQMQLTGFAILNATTGSYITITGIYSKLNIMPGYVGVTTAGYNVKVNGGATSGVVGKDILSYILGDRKFQNNNILNVPSGAFVGQNLYTTKLEKDGTGNSRLMGIEFVNDAYATGQEISIPAGSEIIKGKKVDFAAKIGANSLNYKGVLNALIGSEFYNGTKGARCAWFRNELGNYISKHTDVDTVIQTGTADVGVESPNYNYIAGLSSNAAFHTAGQGNIIRIYKTSDPTNKRLLVPTGISNSKLELARDWAGLSGAPYRTLSAMAEITSKQYLDDGTTLVPDITNATALTVELYGKVLVNADHTNEEVSQIINWREFGAGRAGDDFTTLDANQRNACFSLNDSTTTLAAGASANGPTYLSLGNAVGGLYVLTFVGTGLDLVTNTGAILKICSNLPYGTHTFKGRREGATFDKAYIDGVCISQSLAVGCYSFVIYQPKTPVLTGYKPESAYNILADFVATSLPTRNLLEFGSVVIDQGVMRKTPAREFVYSDASAFYPVNTNCPCGCLIQLGAGKSGRADLTMFAKSNVRFWEGIGVVGDTLNVYIDNVLQGVYTSPYAGSINSRLYSLSSMGIHTFRSERNTTVSYYNVMAMDYHTPIYEPSKWNTNPYFSYQIGSNGLGIYQKDSPIDKKSGSRIYESRAVAKTTFTINSYTEWLDGMLIVLEPGTWLIDIDCNMQFIGTAAPTYWQNNIFLDVDGSASGVFHSTSGVSKSLPATESGGRVIGTNIIKVPRRGAIHCRAYFYHGDGTINTREVQLGTLRATKISEEI